MRNFVEFTYSFCQMHRELALKIGTYQKRELTRMSRTEKTDHIFGSFRGCFKIQRRGSQTTLNGTRPYACNLRCTSATAIVVSQRHGESIRCEGGGEIALLHPRHFSGNASGQAPSFSRRVTSEEVHIRLILAKHLAGEGVESAVDDVVLGPEANSVVGVEEPDVLRSHQRVREERRRGYVSNK